MAAPPSTPQKLAAEALGTAFLVYVGAGSAAATGVIAAGTKVPFSMAQLGMISFAFMLVIGRVAAVAAGGGVTSYNSATMGFGRASLIEGIGTFMLVFVIFGVACVLVLPALFLLLFLAQSDMLEHDH